MSFVDWNTALLRHFFGPELRQSTVIMSVGPDDIDEIAPELGGYSGLLAVVDEGAPWLPRRTEAGNPRSATFENFGAPSLVYQRSHFQPHGYTEPAGLLAWGDGKTGFPAYLPIIAAFIAVYSDNPDDGGFYPAARELFSLPGTWGGEKLNAICEPILKDLVKWSHEEKEGRHGLFHRQPLGDAVRNRYVRWLRGQSILRRTDEPRLRNLFYALGLNPVDPLTDEQEKLLFERMQTENPPFSVGLRLAAAEPTFRDVLLSRLDSLREDWDGCGADQEDRQAVQAVNAPRTVEASLVLFFQDAQPTWVLGLLLPTDAVASDEEAVDEVRVASLSWVGRMTDETYSSGAVAAPLSAVHGALTALHTLSQSPNGRAVIQGCRCAAHLRHRGVRYFVPDGNCLVERDCLPDHDGDAYILVSPPALAGFEQALIANRAENLVEILEPLQASLPTTEWRLYHVPNSHALRSRDIPFQDGRYQFSAFRHVVLAGGSSVNRGGQRWYLPYDPPTLHVDSPRNINIECVPTGIEIAAMRFPNAAHDTPITGSAIHRFTLTAASSGAYSIVARDISGTILGRVKLKIAPWDLAPDVEAKVGLLFDGQTGITGERVCGFDVLDQKNPQDTAQVESATVGASLGAVIENRPSFIQRIRDNGLLQFLNWLALRKAAFVPYGIARKRLLQSAQAAGIRLSTSVIFRALRRRGLLEIVTDRHGRWSGIAGLPFVVTRTCLATDGQSVAAGSGTISFDAWQRLVNQDAPVYCITPFDELDIPVLRFPFDAELPFASRTTPAFLASLSASLNGLKAQWQHIGYEHDPSYDDEWLMCVDGMWKSRVSLLDEGMERFNAPWTLWRSNDPWRNGSSLRVLRQRTAGKYRSRPIVDERWGTWLALESFAGLPQFEGIGKWPLQYYVAGSSIWIPARLNLPLVLERALVACSGAPPREVALTQFANNGNQTYGRDESGTTYGPFAPFYGEEGRPGYLGRDSETRTWLEYCHVPRSIAELVADKLSCRLIDF